MITFATIGTSAITRTFVDAAAGVPEVRVGTVYSRDADRAAEFAGDLGITDTMSDLDALLASDAVDAVYIASPNAIHFEQAVRAIEAGKHVLVEKPAVLRSAEFEQLTALAAKRGVVVLEAMRSAYDPGLIGVGQLVGDLGTVRRASLAYCQRSARYDRVLAGERVNIFDPALGGGALFDLGVYCISAMVGLFGAPDRVLAGSVPITGGADGAGAALALYHGLVVDLSYSKITASSRPCEVQGERGTLTFDSVAQPTVATVTMLGGEPVQRHFPGPPNNMVHEVRRFAELIAGDGDASADHAQTVAVLRVIEAMRSDDGAAGATG